MPTLLLPSSAAPYAPRRSPSVVLDRTATPWLRATLKRVNGSKLSLNNTIQHARCLTKTLASPTAIWTLCSMTVAKAPDAELLKDDYPLIHGPFSFQIIHIEAFVVYVDMVTQNVVAFKLTTETIEVLIDYHQNIYSANAAANTPTWSGKQKQLQNLQEDFVQAAHEFVYRAHAMALEGLEEDGTGELLCGLSEQVKQKIWNLFVPLLPPPAPVVGEVRSIPIQPHPTGPEPWWYNPIPPFAPTGSEKAPPYGPASTESFETNPWARFQLSQFRLLSPAQYWISPAQAETMM